MVSLWGSKKDDDAEARTTVSNGESSEQPRLSEANERTRLLPPPAAGREGFLSPDDPAVSLICYAYEKSVFCK